MRASSFNLSVFYGKVESITLPQALLILGTFLLVTVLAVFFGLVAITANPVFVSVAIGLLLTPLIVAKPDWNIWIILVSGLLVAGVLPIWLEGFSSKVVWVISLLSFVLMLSSLFRAASAFETIRGTPAFVWLALMFMIFTLLNSLIQWSSFYEIAGGFKRYYQVMGLLFALAWLGISERKVHLWRVFFVIIALIQLPWALYQLIELVPVREGIKYFYPGMVPIDVVAGTFGASLYGGGANAEMATFLIVVLAFLLARRREKLIGLGKYLVLLPFILTPLFMGATRVVVILLPFMFVILYRRELIARPLHAVLALSMGTLLTLGAGYVYVDQSNMSFDNMLIDTLSYNVGDRGYGGYTLNRSTVLTFWAEQQGANDPVSAIFGNGLGATHGSSGNVSRHYLGYGISLTAASILLWEQGPIGTALFLSMLVCAWRTSGRLQYEAICSSMRADAAAIQATLPLFAFYLIYRSALLESMPFQIVFYSLLGYLAWLHRQHTTYARAAA